MKGKNWKLANKIFDALNSEGARLGEYSLIIIEQTLDSFADKVTSPMEEKK